MELIIINKFFSRKTEIQEEIKHLIYLYWEEYNKSLTSKEKENILFQNIWRFLKEHE